MALTPSSSSVLCLSCRESMTPGETVAHPGGAAQLEVYDCISCGRKAVISYELRGELSAEEASWVEREVGRRGAFFPSDYGGGGPRFGA